MSQTTNYGLYVTNINDNPKFIDFRKNLCDSTESKANNAILFVTGQSSGTLTISADGELPDVDIPVTIILFS